jgi:hypothetical protein
LSESAIDAIVDYAVGIDGPSPLVFAEVRHAGGAIRRVSGDAAAYGNRDAELLLSVVAAVPSQDAHQNLVAYTDKMKAALRPDLTGGVYMNFLEGAESRGRLRDGLVPGGYERLAQLKAKYDPDNLFRFSFNVAPVDASQAKVH